MNVSVTDIITKISSDRFSKQRTPLSETKHTGRFSALETHLRQAFRKDMTLQHVHITSKAPPSLHSTPYNMTVRMLPAASKHLIEKRVTVCMNVDKADIQF